MHGFDFLVPLFHTHVRGTNIAITSQLVANVLHVPRVELPNSNPLFVSALLIRVSISSLTILTLQKVLGFLTWL